MKHMIRILPLALMALFALPLAAREDVPRGFEPLSDWKQEQAKALEAKRLVILVVKGKDDACPNCAEALDNGLKAIGSGVVKLFARAETIREADTAGMPDAVVKRIQAGFTTGAAVTFVVFNPEMTGILAEAGRKELQSDKKATAEFKKKVQEAKRALR